jgi:hypothetical protein
MNITDKKKIVEFAFKCTTVMLAIMVVFLLVELGKAWKNERFLDAERNKHLITSTNKIE